MTTPLRLAFILALSTPLITHAETVIKIPEPCRPLIVASLQGSAPGVKQALAAKADPNCKVSPGKTTALMFAVASNTLAAVKLLLDKGADPNARDSAGATALMFAAQAGHVDIVRALLKKGADPDLKSGDTSGATALDEARKYGKTQVVRILEPITKPSTDKEPHSVPAWKEALQSSKGAPAKRVAPMPAETK